jgi:glutamine amidotransferase
MTVTIVDYGMGNIASISNMLKSLEVKSEITNDPKKISSASKLILPGVGSFDQGIGKINALPFLGESIKEATLQKHTPLLGICLGMQLIMDSSEEGLLPGLGLIPGKVIKFQRDKEKSTIHMGWNNILAKEPHNPLFENFSEDLRFYFVHGYYVIPEEDQSAIGSTNFGVNFCSVVNRENLWGVQFHPEKSHRFGKLLLRNFVGIKC